jgi:DNA-binding response OmpR family regulator
MKVLIVEDEKELSQSICEYLSGELFTCEQAFDYRTAVEKMELYDYACIVLDINLPDGNGLSLLKVLKAESKTDGVIIVSARNAIDDKVTGLKDGADDYLTKPFHLSELGARIGAIIRRKSFKGKNLLQFDEVKIDLNAKEVLVGDTIIDFTKKEFDLLLYFASNKNKVISKNAIAIHLWGDDFDTADNYDFIYTHIKNLRKKLVAAGAPDYIRSVYGSGYKFSLRQ